MTTTCEMADHKFKESELQIEWMFPRLSHVSGDLFFP